MPTRKTRAFSAQSNKFISLKLARSLVTRYRKAAPASEHGGWFSLTPLMKLLGQKGAGGLRIYHGLDAKGMYRMILVATNAQGDDLLPSRHSHLEHHTSGHDGHVYILDTHLRCPPSCGRESPLS